MKNSVRTLAALMAAVCVLGCSKEADNHIEEPVEKEKEPVVIEKVPMTFSVGTAKTVLIPRIGQSGFDIGFHKVDKISIFDCNDDNNDFVNDASNDGQREVKFSGKAAKSDIYYALYPYQYGAELGENEITNVVLPATQTATANSFDPKANISVDKALGNTLYLKNVCSLFKIVVNAGEHYDKAVISSNDGSSICGTLSIDFDTDKNPVVGKNITDGSPSVTLEGEMGSQDQETVYYAVILPGTYSRGINVKLYKDGQTTAYATRSSSSSIAISRAKIATFGHIKPDLLPGKFTVNASGKQVQFSKGNLWCDASTGTGTDWKWAFEENQWDAPTLESHQDKSYKDFCSHVSHFYPTICGNDTDDKLGYGAGSHNPQISSAPSEYQKGDWGVKMGEKNYWTGITESEMKYLLNTRSGGMIGSSNQKRYARVKVEVDQNKTFNCILLVSDNFTWNKDDMGKIPNTTDGQWNYQNNTYTITQCNAIEAAGGVFLPCSGYRERDSGQVIFNNLNTNAHYELNESTRLQLYIGAWDLNNNYTTEAKGSAVRLVHVVPTPSSN